MGTTCPLGWVLLPAVGGTALSAGVCWEPRLDTSLWDKAQLQPVLALGDWSCVLGTSDGISHCIL